MWLEPAGTASVSRQPDPGGWPECGCRRMARRLYEENLARNLFLRSETARWVARLRQDGIPCQALKGAAWSLLLYGDLGARASADIDLLVPPEQRDAAIRLVEHAGYRPILAGRNGNRSAPRNLIAFFVLPEMSLQLSGPNTEDSTTGLAPQTVGPPPRIRER